MVETLIECRKCHAKLGISEYVLIEGALLVCPNCGAEFSLTATLETLPDGDEEDQDMGMEPEPQLPDLPDAPLPSPSPEIAPEIELPISASRIPASREPVVEVYVLACNECKTSWVGAHARRCPRCRSESIMRTNTTVAERALEAVDEIEMGVPAPRALAKLLGKYRPKKTVRARS